MPAIGREMRQRIVAKLILDRFGAEHANSVPQRAVRFLEEAVEAYQAAGADKEMAHKLIDFVFDRPKGDLAKEIGQCGLTLLGFAAAAKLDADKEEYREVSRVVIMDPREHVQRNIYKNLAGFDTTGGAYPTELHSDRRIGKHPGLGMPYGSGDRRK